jgi:flagellar M-ring protein FliF
MNGLLDGLKSLGVAKLAAMGAVALGLLSFLAMLSLRGGSEQMALLYADLDLRESAQVVEHLSRQKIPYQIGAQSAQILVPANQVAQARVMLARDGLPSSGSIGYEIFDRNDGITTTQFQQKIAETRAMEGEIARTIRSLRGVRAARVHLVLPRREPFARDRQDAQASVLLTMSGVSRPDAETVQAILNLVAAAVPGLRPQNIAIVDSRGNVLARAGSPTTVGANSQGTEDVRRATELRLQHAVEEMLERSLGPGRVRAEAAVEMDFERINETQERYDPDGQVPRSTQSVTTSSRNTEASSTVSAQNNLPNADAGGNGGPGSQESRQEETTNFEIGRTVRTLIREQPQIRRVSLAVMVDGVAAPGPDGKPIWRARSEAELAQLSTLVKTAIGFNEKRGDTVQVVSMRFVSPEELAPPPNEGWFGISLEKPDLMRLAETLMIGLIGLVALLMILRPMVLRLTLAGPGGLAVAGPGRASSGAAGGGVASPGMPALPAGAGGGAHMALPGGSPLAIQGHAGLSPEEESMVSVTNIEGQMRASSLRRVAEMAEKNPEETLAIIRGWMAREAG